ncbi:nitroreductase [Ferrimonas pelagia]|uniref:Nitroreductase n=1 Tax=Ferrimonas pelagia TaxID=1177826 RepID=A0ABP9ELM2_9GAMM
MTHVAKAILQRRSIRVYSQQSVPEQTVAQLLLNAGQSASGSNLQPWKVYALTGEAKDALINTVADRAMTNPRGEAGGIPIYPDQMDPIYLQRRNACAELMYQALQIPREDKVARLQQIFKNFQFFGAPVGLIITMDRKMEGSQLLDCGIFLQSIMLLAEEQGLATCPQASWCMWPDTINEVLGLDPQEVVVAGLSLGYAEPDAAVNQIHQPRQPAKQYISLRGF